MGRDIAGLRVGGRRPMVINGVALDTLDRVHVAPKVSIDQAETNEQEVEDHTPRSISREKIQEKQDVLGVKSTNTEASVPEDKTKGEALKPIEKKLTSPIKPVASSQSPELSNDKIASNVSNISGVGNIHAGISPSSNTSDFSSPATAKNLQPNSPSVSMKPMLHDGNTKHDDEEDNYSLTSSYTPSSAATSVRTIKYKVTVPVAPTFRSAERLQRRKEFYMKIEEKHKALEAEKQKHAERTKEEEEAAIEQLRKSMVYKANPVPNFYREGPPPKPELKKLPVTRAKSPNLTRRKSCNDAVKSSPDEKKACAQATRHSIGIYKDGHASPRTPQNKDISSTRYTNGPSKLKESNGICKTKARPKQVKEPTKTSHVESEQISTDIPAVPETKHSYTTTEEETKASLCE